MNSAIFFAGMLAMALLSGLIVFLFIRPWIRPMRRSIEASHEVIIEKSRLSAAQVRTQAEEEDERTMQAAIATQQSRSQLIHEQGGNDRAEIQRKSAFRQAKTDERIQAIRDETAIENARASLIEARTENDQLEIKRRAALKRAGINPDAPKPKNWFVRHRYLTVMMIAVLVFIVMILIRITTN